MRILLDIRDKSIDLDILINPIRYFSFLYDEIYILTNTHEKSILGKIFSYDPTIFITNKEETLNLSYKKMFDFRCINLLTKENLYEHLEITDEIIKKYFSNF
jgi:hypothetical protein